MSFSLQNYTTYTPLRGFGDPDQWAKRASDLGYPALGICDTSSFGGHIAFQSACNKYGVKPIFGVEFLFVDEVVPGKKSVEGTILLYAKSDTGYEDLIRVNNWAQTRAGGFYFVPRVSLAYLEENPGDLICVLHPYDPPHFYGDCAEEFTSTLERLSALFGDDFYLGWNPIDDPTDNHMRKKEVRRAYSDAASSGKYQVIPIYNCHRPTQDTEHLYKILRKIDNFGNFSHSRDRDVVDGHLPETIVPSPLLDGIAQKCNVTIPTGTFFMPHYELVRGSTIEEDFLWFICQGIRQKFHRGFQADEMWSEAITKGKPLEWLCDELSASQMGSESPHERRTKYPDAEMDPISVYLERLKEEFEIIESLGFVVYFLIVLDICLFADRTGVERGPARGSAAGSVVSYLLDITKLDPVEFDLLFSRFLNPDRNDLPDIDLDFSSDHRGKIKQYIQQKYGEDRVVSIGSYEKYKVASAINDVMRVHNWSIRDDAGHIQQYTERFITDVLSGFVPNTLRGRDEFEARLEHPEFKEFYSKHTVWFDRVIIPLLESVSNVSIHPAGMLIASDAVDKIVPIREKRVADGRLEPISQWRDSDCEKRGLPKFDILSIKAIDIISYAKELIRERHGVEIPAINEVPLDVPEVYELFGNAHTDGIFQYRSWLQHCQLRALKPRNFTELYVGTAMKRPGPIDVGADELYLAIKRGQLEPYYEHPDMVPITESTLGFLVFQEQIMKTVSVIGGLSGIEADHVRKACGKKQLSEMASWERKFRDGCVENGYDESLADELWPKIVSFAAYGFNKTISEQTHVLRAGSNENMDTPWIQIKELVRLWEERVDGRLTPIAQKLRGGKLSLIQMDEDGRCRPGRLIKIHDHGVKEVFQLRMESGHVTPAMSRDHRVLTTDGYKAINTGLGVGSEVVFMGEIEPKAYSAWWASDDSRFSQTGRATDAYRAMCDRVWKRDKGICTECQAPGERGGNGHEVAHILTPAQVDYDIDRYHSTRNLRLLCNSCHKKLDYEKGQRTKRWQKGRPTYVEKVVAIERVGEHHCYDLEMASDGHNYVAAASPDVPGLISHNSHSASYALISYYQAWIKAFYPVEFWCAAFKYASTVQKDFKSMFNMKGRCVKEGVGVVFPTIHGFSEDFYPKSDTEIFWPIVGIKGIGPSTVDKLTGDGKYSSFDSIEDMIDKVGENLDIGIIKRLCRAGFFAPCGATKAEAVANVFRVYNEKLGKKHTLPYDLEVTDDLDWLQVRNDIFGFVVEPWKSVSHFHENIMSIPEGDVARIPDGTRVLIGGRVDAFRIKYTRKNNNKFYADCVITDDGEKYRIKMWPSFWENMELDREDRRPQVGDLIEIIGEKESFLERPQITVSRPGSYCKIIRRANVYEAPLK